MGDEATLRLAAVLGIEAAEKLQTRANSRNRQVDLAEPRWTAEGYTGARLAAVVERSLPPSPQRPRKYVVKVCPADGRRREGTRHHAALEQSPPGFADRHLVSMEGDPVLLPGGGELLLQNIAGASLARCRPMSEYSAEDRARTAAALARALTQEWTHEHAWRLEVLTVSRFLRTGLDGASAGETTDPVQALGVDATLLASDADWLETPEDGPDTPLVNPLALLDGWVGGQDDRIEFVTGLTHGDLHEDNVLVPRLDGSVEHESFRLVDLSAFDAAAPLGSDLAMLAVSSLVRRFSERTPEQNEALLHRLVERSHAWVAGTSPDAVALVDEVRHAARPSFVPAEFEENWSEQLLLLLVAAALLHLSFPNVGAEARWWLFRLAGHACTASLGARGTDAPARRRRIDRQAVTALRAPNGDASRPPRTAERVLPVDDGYRRSVLVVVPGPDQDGETAAQDATVTSVLRSFRAIGYDCSDADVVHVTGPEEPRNLIAERLAQAGPRDAIAMYVTGAFESLETMPGGPRRTILRTPHSRPGHDRGALPLASLLEGLRERPRGEPAGALLLVLDVGDADPDEVAREATATMSALASGDGGPAVMHLVVAGRPEGESDTGFAAVWERALTAADGPPRDRPYLAEDDLTHLLLRPEARPGHSVRVLSPTRPGPNRALPNPRHHLVGVDPGEMSSWWEPTARATAHATTHSLRSAWFFSGRRKLNGRVAEWLADPSEPVLVLTGTPGSGKSTVMARTVVATVPDLRERLRGHPDAFRPQETPPEDFRFALAMRLTKLSAEQVKDRVEQLTEASGTATPGQPPVIALDGLDEAVDPHRIVAEVLRPLVQRARAGGPRLLIATRSQPVGHDPTDVGAPRGDLIGPLVADGGTVVDVGEAPWLETGDIAQYCDRLLSVEVNDLDRPNIYVNRPRARRVLARAIETEARHSFLLASHVARRHTLDSTPTDAQSPAWRRQFPRGIGDAMRQEIEALYGVDEADRQLALLRPLAFAQGIGLTREPAGATDLWALLATRLDPDGRTFLDSDVTGLLEQRVATHLVMEVDTGGSSAYRFHHEALAESFLTGHGDRTEAHRAIAGALLGTLVTKGSRYWPQASTYLRRALPEHARQGGELALLADDPGLLMYCDPDRLHEALVSSRTERLVSLSRLMRPYLHRLRTATALGRGFLLSVAATVMNRHGLADALAAAAGMPVTVTQVRVRHEALRQSVAEGTRVLALTCANSRSGDPLLFVANGRFLDVRDPDSGALVETVLSGSAEVLGMVGYLDDDGFPVVATASGDGGVRVWDATTRGLRAENPVDFRRGIVHGIGVDGTVFLAGWTDDRVGIWRPGGTDEVLVLPVEWEPGRQPVTDATVVRDGDGTALLAVAAGGRVTVWEPGTGRLRHNIDLGTALNIRLAALQPWHPDGPVLITTGMREKEALLWRPSTGPRPWPFSEVPLCTASWEGNGDHGVALGHLSGAVDLWNGDERTPPRRLQEAGRTIHSVHIGPPGADRPVITAMDTEGRIRVWERAPGRDSTTMVGSTAHSVAMGLLREGGRYLAVGHNIGADLWRLDEVSREPEAYDLHDADAHLIAVDAAESRFATLGDDGRIHLWSAPGGHVLGTMPIPTGRPFGVVGWSTPDGGQIAVTSASLLQVFALEPGRGVLLEREWTAPGRLAVLERPTQVLLAVADRQQVHVVDPATGAGRDLTVPEVTSSGQPLSQATRNVIGLAWVSAPGSDPVLVAGTQGGLLARWAWNDDGQAHVLPPLETELGFVTVVTPVPGGDGMRVLCGGPHGGLAVYDAVDGSLVHDLATGGARVVGATVVDASPPVVVVAELADDACRVRVWNPLSGRWTGAVVHRPLWHDAYVGPPRAGRTAHGRRFVVYEVEDGVELLMLDRPAHDDSPVRLLLPFTVNDIAVRGDAIYLAGGGGHMRLTVDDRAAPNPDTSAHPARRPR
ncbi:hypothetical protein ACIBCS_41915 [Streptomyces phaeochromogenes]|uniref:hypothetical protein n=1 Tax=Streptomyces phaeochromogenes TaxID=1923 RepID=UPI0033CBFBDD